MFPRYLFLRGGGAAKGFHCESVTSPTNRHPPTAVTSRQVIEDKTTKETLSHVTSIRADIVSVATFRPVVLECTLGDSCDITLGDPGDITLGDITLLTVLLASSKRLVEGGASVQVSKRSTGCQQVEAAWGQSYSRDRGKDCG